MSPFPPGPDEILDRLLRILRPPRPPKFFPRAVEEGLPRRRRIVTGTGSRMIWPWRITYKESPRGRGQIKVLKEERTVGTVSFESRAERIRIMNLLGDIIRGGR